MFEIISFIKDYIIGFFVLISVLVFVHEYGHYIFARMFKVHVESFSIGFGSEIFGWTDKNGTRWKICPIPFGGYVKMKGEMAFNPSDKDTAVLDENSFQSKALWQKFLIVFGGPLFNLIFPIFILAFISFFAGVSIVKPIIGKVLKDAPSYGILKKNDQILAIEGKSVNNFSDLQSIVATNPGKKIQLKIKRNNRVLTIPITIGTGKDKNISSGFLGIIADYSQVTHYRYSLVQSIQYSYNTYIKACSLIIGGLYKLFTGNVSSNDIGGPLKIAQISGDTLKEGLDSWLFFMAMLSLNLAIINLFPIPALDGGHLLLYLIQGITRKQINYKIQNKLMQVGFFLLILLMVVVVVKDILSFIK